MGLGAIIEGSQRRGEPHITRKGVNILLIEVRLTGFPAKSAQHRFLLRVIPDPIGAPGHPACVVVFGVGQDRGFGDGFEQPEADHGRGNACRKTGVRVHRAIAQLGDLQGWFAQLDFGAVLEPDGNRLVVDAHFAFRDDAGHRHVL